MKSVIDRFEGEFAVVVGDDGGIRNIKRNLLPQDVQEGDVLIIENDTITVDRDETERRKKDVEKYLDLWEK